MFLINFIKNVLKGLNEIEQNLNAESRFSKSQLNEIMQNTRKGNFQFLHSLLKINALSAFDLSYILSSIDLNEKKVNIIKHAVDMYKESEFSGQGQTISDYVFKVASNINLLTETNLDVFKELAQCKSDIYDFTKALKNPSRYIKKKEESKAQFCFSTVLVEE